MIVRQIVTYYTTDGLLTLSAKVFRH